MVKTVLPVQGAWFPSLSGQVAQGNQKKKKRKDYSVSRGDGGIQQCASYESRSC